MGAVGQFIFVDLLGLFVVRCVFRGQIGFDLLRGEMLVVELAVFVEADDGAEEFQVVFADEQRAGPVKQLSQSGRGVELLGVVVHIGERHKAVDAEERERAQLLFVDVESS